MFHFYAYRIFLFLFLSFFEAVRHKNQKACHKHHKQLPVILFS